MSEQSNQSAGLQVAATADVDERAVLGPGTAVWHLAQIREHARLGRDCIVGRGAYVGPGVVIGNNVKLQNYALVYEPAQLEDGVFIGPAVVLTNDTYPRSVDVSGKLKRPSDWTPEGVIVREGASLGAWHPRDGVLSCLCGKPWTGTQSSALDRLCRGSLGHPRPGCRKRFLGG